MRPVGGTCQQNDILSGRGFRARRAVNDGRCRQLSAIVYPRRRTIRGLRCGIDPAGLLGDNMKTATAIGIAVPLNLQQLADQLIE
jgi:hypothetical protein